MGESWALVCFIVIGNILIILASPDDSRCGHVLEEGRVTCGYPGVTRGQCHAQGCCWDADAADMRKTCYQKGCAPGRFGWGCRFYCQCDRGAVCDPVSGQCPTTCPVERWGVGCILDSRCTYNDEAGQHYMGQQTRTKKGYTCGNWTLQKHYPASHFPEKHLNLASNFCRNPKPIDTKTWCYHSFTPKRKWDYCMLRPCDCEFARFGVNCDGECHCKNVNEACDTVSGTCVSGCDHRWKGSNCQECADFQFGPQCLSHCHCYDEQEACDKVTGRCDSGCAAGWTDDDCQTECGDGTYGKDCMFTCNCQTKDEACSKSTGRCVSGCATGYSGRDCQITCRCLNPDEMCGADTGSCQSGCQIGWMGTACDIEIPRLVKAPHVLARDQRSVTIEWQSWSRNRDRGNGPVVAYYVYYKATNSSEVWHKLRVAAESSDQQHAVVDGLHANVGYIFKVSPLHEEATDDYPSPTVSVVTCGKPSQGPTHIRINATRQHWATMDGSDGEANEAETHHHSTQHVKLVIKWELPPEEVWGCDKVIRYRVYHAPPGKGFSFWKITEYAHVIVHDVNVFSNYSIGVTLLNSAQEESDMTVATYIGRSSGVLNLKTMQVTSRSLFVTWDPPEHPNSRVLHYIVRYKEMRISDCDVEESTWSDHLLANSTHPSVNLTGLHPASKYQYRVRAFTDKGRGKLTTHTGTTMSIQPQVAVEGVTEMSLSMSKVRFVWDFIECEERYGRTHGYEYELLETESDTVVQRDYVLETQVGISELTPYTEYSFRVRFANHVGAGPYSYPVTFTTLSARPPMPEYVQVVLKTSSALSISWQPPIPSHGLLTDYEVKYWSLRTVNHPLFSKVSASHLSYNISGLTANTSFGFQVRAYTDVGYGEWSQIMYGFTEEGAPGSPHAFQNVSRSVSSLTFTWELPRKPSGILREFKIDCTPGTYMGRRLPRTRSGVVKATAVKRFVVSDLEPGTKYVCSLAASTSKGFGDRATGTYWTLPKKPLAPEPPVIKADKSTDRSIVVILKPTEDVSSKNMLAKSMNQVVVERREPDTADDGRSRHRRETGESPCNLSYLGLVDHETAARRGLTCYVAASLDVTVEQVFVIGDNLTYGRYHNAPLETGTSYEVWYGAVIDVDGVTVASYSKSETPTVAAFMASPTPTEATMIIAGVGVAAMVAVVCLLILVVLLIVRRRRRRNARNEGELIIGNNLHSGDGPPNRPPRKCDTNGTNGHVATHAMEKVDGLPELGTGSTEDLVLGDHSEMEPLYRNVHPEPQHGPVSVENLWNYVKEKKGSKTDGIRQEYDELPMGLRAKCEIARRQENKVKNRYGNIVAYDHSRVILACLPDDPHSDYINADYVDAYRKPGAFIATQGPSKHTLNDIWRLAWQENSRRIVMVTNLVEDGRHKCENYWPDAEPRLYGEVWVELVKQEQLADFTIRTFHITKDNDTKTLRQFHFTAWPDHGVPTYATSLLAFRKKVRSFDDPSAGPTIVHCSAGVGRTGTFIALDFLLDQAKVEGQVDVFSCVQDMRSKRVNMIQTQEQYVFVYDALLESLKCGDTSIPCVDFRHQYAEMNSKVSEETGKIRLEEEFELLGIMSPPLDSTSCRDALDPDNIHKNRYTHIVPLDDQSRAYLSTYTPESTDYINAVFVDGYRQRDAFIVTQMPLDHTIMDLWLMVFDQRCKTIIMMNELNLKEDTCACYWPEEGSPYEVGPLIVELKSTDNTRNDIIIRDFAITMKRKPTTNKDPEAHFVRQFQYLAWPRDLPVPANRSSIITLITLVEKWQQHSGNHIITVHCMDGATQSGVFCATSYMLERLKVEQEVDVFQSTKHIRINRPHLVPTMDQYRFLYEMAIEYMDCFDAYANFK